MTNRNKALGTAWESAIVGYLQWRLSNRRIERRALAGAKDRGDIAGFEVNGLPVVIEAKRHARYDIGGWLKETESERVNDNALAGIVVAKRPRKTDPADALVVLTLRDLTALLTGERK